jgi:methyl-accepting chemotaxis protein
MTTQDLTLFNSLPVPAFSVDEAGRIIAWNKALAVLTGRGSEEAVGRRVWQCFYDARQATPVDEALLVGAEVEKQQPFAGPDGEPLAMSWSVSPLMADDGDVCGATAVLSAPSGGAGCAGGGALEAKIEALRGVASAAARGDFSVALPDYGDDPVGLLARGIGGMIETVRGLIEEINTLIGAGRHGDLRARVNPDGFDGGFREVVDGVNEMLDLILSPIDELSDCLGRVARGQLDAYVSGQYEGDHATLKNALNTSLDSLNETLRQVQIASDQIASGSQQVSSSSQALSDGASRQAASIEEISASIADMTDQTKQNANNAGQANELTAAAGELAVRGDSQMQAMVRAMAEIDESSQNISKIIKVIDEIAFQTNLLALNAAVEAARAGVHGKGFAVVAEEVRNLAARSANAAKETTVMIEGSIKKVSQGSAIARETAEALTQIVESVGKVSGLVAEIAQASNEQAQGIAQINQGLQLVDQVTQQNTSGAEESASAAEELARQASRLKELLGRFSLSLNLDDEFDSPANGSTVVPLRAVREGGSRAADVIPFDDVEFGRY